MAARASRLPLAPPVRILPPKEMPCSQLHHPSLRAPSTRRHARVVRIRCREARSGLLPAGLYVTVIVLGNLAIGAFAAPARTAFALARRAGRSLFSVPVDYEALLD